jgi:hypothetical protein
MRGVVIAGAVLWVILLFGVLLPLGIAWGQP